MVLVEGVARVLLEKKEVPSTLLGWNLKGAGVSIDASVGVAGFGLMLRAILDNTKLGQLDVEPPCIGSTRRSQRRASPFCLPLSEQLRTEPHGNELAAPR